jgi:hypothetical protein
MVKEYTFKNYDDATLRFLIELRESLFYKVYCDRINQLEREIVNIVMSDKTFSPIEIIPPKKVIEERKKEEDEKGSVSIRDGSKALYVSKGMVLGLREVDSLINKADRELKKRLKKAEELSKGDKK